MDIILEDQSADSDIVTALKKCSDDDAICCKSEDTFKRAKTLLLQEKLKNVTIQLLDEDGYAIRQVTSKPKEQGNRDQLSGRQVAVIKALEKVLRHCKKEGIQLVGYSDELVALPSHIPIEEISSAGALDINCYDVYKGADAIMPDTSV